MQPLLSAAIAVSIMLFSVNILRAAEDTEHGGVKPAAGEIEQRVIPAQKDDGENKGKINVVICFDPNSPQARSLQVTVNALKLRFGKKVNLFEQLDPNKPEDYRRLADLEREAGVKPEQTDAVEVFIGREMFPGADFLTEELVYYLERLVNPIKGRVRDRYPEKYEKARRKAIALMGNPENVVGKPEIEQYRQIEFQRLEMDFGGVREHFFLAYVYAPIACPVCGDAEFFVTINRKLKVVGFTPVREMEVKNTPVNAETLFDSLKKFLNTEPSSLPFTNLRIDGISGATKTNNAYINQCRRLGLWLDKKRKKEKIGKKAGAAGDKR